MLNPEAYKKYNAKRYFHQRKYACHAPFVSLNFDQEGKVTACCYNRHFELGNIQEHSIAQIWNGNKIKELRTLLENLDFSQGCESCAHQINAGNFMATRAKGFDHYADKPTDILFKKLKGLFSENLTIWPKVLEFEIDNTCNLECVMCSGRYSSLIRKNREKLPPLLNPYNNDFIEQLRDFIKHAKEIKFLGGEPFLSPLYYKIWELIAEINPTIDVYVTTNATVLTQKVKDLLEKLRFHLVISIDSFTKDNYEKIRLNGNFDKLSQNLEYFAQYSKNKKRELVFAVCPMTLNAYEIPHIIEKINAYHAKAYFNTVFNPFEYSFQSMNYDEICKLEQFLVANKPHSVGKFGNQNKAVFTDFLVHIQYLKKEKVQENMFIDCLESAKEKTAQKGSLLDLYIAYQINLYRNTNLYVNTELSDQKMEILALLTEKNFEFENCGFFDFIQHFSNGFKPENKYDNSHLKNYFIQIYFADSVVLKLIETRIDHLLKLVSDCQLQADNLYSFVRFANCLQADFSIDELNNFNKIQELIESAKTAENSQILSFILQLHVLHSVKLSFEEHKNLFAKVFIDFAQLIENVGIKTFYSSWEKLLIDYNKGFGKACSDAQIKSATSAIAQFSTENDKQNLAVLFFIFSKPLHLILGGIVLSDDMFIREKLNEIKLYLDDFISTNLTP